MLGSLAKMLSGDSFRLGCDHVFWCNEQPQENNDFRHGDTVFCKIDEVWRIFRALRRSRRRIVLVTGEGDRPVSQEIWKQKPPHVDQWFGPNMFVDEANAHGLPLGLGSASCSVTLKDPGTGNASEFGNRGGLLYVNFRTETNPGVRGPLMSTFQKKKGVWLTVEDPAQGTTMESYQSRLADHAFVLCPPGNGEDTHRMWEALYSGTIPIVRSSLAMNAFRDLPIVIIDDFDQISESFLRGRLERMRSAHFNHAKLEASFWLDKIRAQGARLRRESELPLSKFLRGWMDEGLRVCGRCFA
jgi:hypothetical protein